MAATQGTRQSSGGSDFEYLTPIGYSRSTRCGYCGDRSQSKRFSYYASASSLSAAFYQTLLNRCWRRSGTLLYRPNQRESCCPHYTIRLDSNEFKPSRTQRQTANRFNKFVLGDSYIKESATLHPRSKAEVKKRDNEYVLADRIHEAEYDRLATPPEPAHKLVVTLEEDNFTEEKFAVYSNYQQVVHKDPPEDRTRRGFKRFLCSSPLRREKYVGPDGRVRQLGSYHQCYRLDGKLVAIGVLDLLPDCVSSVYFLYDESIHMHYPGKLGALHEISLAHEKGYRWWYAGFYIHSCPKMRYKIDYAPQNVLDPVSLKWNPLDEEMLALLDQKPFVSLFLEQQRKSKTGEPLSEGLDSVSKRPITMKKESDNEESEDDSDTSLFLSRMPGIAPLAEMKWVNLDNIAIKVSLTGPLYTTSALVAWERTRVDQWPGIKAAVAELVAALGIDCVDVLCVDLTRAS